MEKCEAARGQGSSSCYCARPLLCDNHHTIVVIDESLVALVALVVENEARHMAPAAVVTLEASEMVAVVHIQKNRVWAHVVHQILVDSLLCVVFVWLVQNQIELFLILQAHQTCRELGQWEVVASIACEVISVGEAVAHASTRTLGNSCAHCGRILALPA